MKTKGKKSLDELNHKERIKPFTTEPEWRLKTTDAMKLYCDEWFLRRSNRKLIAATFTIKNYKKYCRGDGGIDVERFVEVDRIMAEETLRHFGNFLDRALAPKNSTRKEKQKFSVEKLFTLEMKTNKSEIKEGPDGHKKVVSRTPHFHGVIVLPDNIRFDYAKRMIEECWEKTLYGWEQKDISSHYTDEDGNERKIDTGWVSYISKFWDAEDEVSWFSTTK